MQRARKYIQAQSGTKQMIQRHLGPLGEKIRDANLFRGNAFQIRLHNSPNFAIALEQQGVILITVIKHHVH